MKLPINDGCELSTSELEAISAGLLITHGPNPPIAGGCHHPYQPPQPPRYFPGGVPNDPALNFRH